MSNTPNNIQSRILRLSDAEYNGINAMNASGLKKFMVSPMHYRHWLDTKDQEDESGTSLRFGRALHCLALEGTETFNNKFAITPVVDRRTKEGKLAWQSFNDSNAGRDFVTADEFATAQQMADRFRSNPLIAEMLERGVVTEGVLLGDINGAPFKGRFDMLCPSTGVMVDLKSMGKPPTYWSVKKAIRDYNYNIQEAVYRKLCIANGFDLHEFIFTFIEKDCPHGIFHASNSIDVVHSAYDDLDILAASYVQCKNTDTWPGAGSETNVLVIE